MTTSTKRWIMVVVVTLSIIALDQITKQIVIENLETRESYAPIPEIRDLFQITRSSNNGAAFGVLPQAGDFFLVIAVVVVGALLIFYPRIEEEARVTRFATGMVCGGAIGNAIDRIRHEHVIDFIHYQIPDVVSNISNLADHAIVLGVIAIIIDSWRLERLENQAESANSESETPGLNSNFPYNEEEQTP